MLQEQMVKVQPVPILRIYLDTMAIRQDFFLLHTYLMLEKELELMENQLQSKNFQIIFGRYMIYWIHKK